MMTMRGWLPLAVCVLGLTAPITADAQPRNDSNISLDAPGLLVRKPKPGPPDVKAQPLAWPRLDPGAVLCRSEADLGRLAQRRSGQIVDGPVDCQIVRAPSGITIVQRKGAGQTEVRMTGPQAGSGWTDAWLPDKAPGGATAAAR